VHHFPISTKLASEQPKQCSSPNHKREDEDERHPATPAQ